VTVVVRVELQYLYFTWLFQAQLWTKCSSSNKNNKPILKQIVIQLLINSYY